MTQRPYATPWCLDTRRLNLDGAPVNSRWLSTGKHTCGIPAPPGCWQRLNRNA